MATPVDPTRPRRRRTWLYVLAAMAVLLAVAVGYGVAKVTSGASDVGRGQLLPTAPATPQPSGATTVTRPTRPASAGDSLNFLVVRRSGDARSAADAVALVHVNHDRSRVDVVTVDARATAPGSGDTLAATHAEGGTAALVTAVEQTTQVPMDHAAEVTRPGFDALQQLLSGGAFANPLAAQGDLDTVMQNITVDDSLDQASMRELAFDLASTGKPTMHSLSGADLADAATKKRLQDALQNDDLASL